MTELRIWWRCEHCRQRAVTLALSTDDAQAISDRVAEAHSIASPDCHALHGPDGLYLNASGAQPPNLWEM